jgi:hypothetical protein
VVMVPMVVMLEMAAIAVPVACVIPAAFMARTDPAGSRVWRARPIAPMPSVMPSVGIPVAVNPDKLRPRTWRKHANHAWGRWRPDADSNGNLSRERQRAGQQEACDQ